MHRKIVTFVRSKAREWEVSYLTGTDRPIAGDSRSVFKVSELTVMPYETPVVLMSVLRVRRLLRILWQAP
jgi:hypothetical protein